MCSRTQAGARCGLPAVKGGAGWYSSESWMRCAASLPATSAATVSAKSIPAVTPRPLKMLPARTTRAFAWVAPTSGKRLVYAQCVVARRPFSNPATPSRNAPVQTDVTYFALAACRRTKSMVSASAMAPETPNPPGTQRRSSGPHAAKVVVGTKPRPQSVATGWSDLAAMCAQAPGSRCSTCKGPVKSSWVTLGKSTKPMLKAMGAPSGSVGPSGSVLLQRLALGDARDVEALEVAVALVEFEAYPDEQVVEGVGTETERQA